MFLRTRNSKVFNQFISVINMAKIVHPLKEDEIFRERLSLRKKTMDEMITYSRRLFFTILSGFFAISAYFYRIIENKMIWIGLVCGFIFVLIIFELIITKYIVIEHNNLDNEIISGKIERYGFSLIYFLECLFKKIK